MSFNATTVTQEQKKIRKEKKNWKQKIDTYKLFRVIQSNKTAQSTENTVKQETTVTEPPLSFQESSLQLFPSLQHFSSRRELPLSTVWLCLSHNSCAIHPLAQALPPVFVSTKTVYERNQEMYIIYTSAFIIQTLYQLINTNNKIVLMFSKIPKCTITLLLLWGSQRISNYLSPCCLWEFFL